MGCYVVQRHVGQIRGTENTNEPFVVLGTGRCGTSTVARILQERCGVRMCKDPRIGHPMNPKGLYEDQELQQLNAKWMGSPMWSDHFERWLKRRRDEGVLWGFKNAKTVLWWQRLWPYLSWGRVIVCVRNFGDTLRSFENWYPIKGKIRLALDQYLKGLYLWLNDAGTFYLVVDVDDNPTDDEIHKAIVEAFGL